jgi:cytochrome P450
VAKYVLEALRFNPHNPGAFRIAAEDYVVAKGTLRATEIPKGTRVLAATQSAMFDKLKVDEPESFRVDRPAHVYMHWGYGLHTCFGRYINETQIPLIVQAVLKRKNLRRAAGNAGTLQYDGRFPASMTLQFDT